MAVKQLGGRCGPERRGGKNHGPLRRTPPANPVQWTVAGGGARAGETRHMIVVRGFLHRLTYNNPTVIVPHHCPAGWKKQWSSSCAKGSLRIARPCTRQPALPKKFVVRKICRRMRQQWSPPPGRREHVLMIPHFSLAALLRMPSIPVFSRRNDFLAVLCRGDVLRADVLSGMKIWE